MKHKIKEEEKLLRGEFLAIVAAMITRLERFSSTQHLYIPVSRSYWMHFFPFANNLSIRFLCSHSWDIFMEGSSRHIMTGMLWSSERQSSIIFCLKMPETCLVFSYSRWQTHPSALPRGCRGSIPRRRRRASLKTFLCDKGHQISDNSIFLLIWSKDRQEQLRCFHCGWRVCTYFTKVRSWLFSSIIGCQDRETVCTLLVG